MAKTVAAVLSELDQSLVFGRAAGWDPVGLQFGDPSRDAERLGVCHEVTASVAEAAATAGIDLLISYHPLIFKPLDRIVAGPGPEGLVFRLLQSGVALGVVHTAFDVAPGGAADALAAALGLHQLRGFAPLWGADTVKVVTFAPAASIGPVTAAMADAGAGRIGAYSACSYRSEGVGSFFAPDTASPHVGRIGSYNEEAEIRVEMVAASRRIDSVVAALVASHPYEEPAYDVIATRSNAGFVGRTGSLDEPLPLAQLAERVSATLGGVVRTAGSGTVETVGVVPGSGGSLLSLAGADVVVTGDVSHHQARGAVAADRAVIDPGHAASERPGVQALYAALADAYDDVVDLTDVDADPWKEG